MSNKNMNIMNFGKIYENAFVFFVFCDNITIYEKDFWQNSVFKI